MSRPHGRVINKLGQHHLSVEQLETLREITFFSVAAFHGAHPVIRHSYKAREVIYETWAAAAHVTL